MKFQHVGNSMRVKRNISTPSHGSLDKFFIEFCFSIKHLGVNKCLSNTCIIENYLETVRGKVLSLLFAFAELKYS